MNRSRPPRCERAPAKINLGLRVIGRRADGYHQIESLFLPLDLVDDVEVTTKAASAGVSTRIELEDGLPGVPDERDGPGHDSPDFTRNNLVAQAARAFLAATAVELQVDVTLRKRIPVGAGLGGGSSDAAAVLRALTQLHPDLLPPGDLAQIALSLGADVPFFLNPQPAWVTGIGESIEPVAAFPGLVLLLLNPGVSIATADVYAAFDAAGGALTRISPGSTMRALAGLRQGGQSESERLAAWAQVVVNDLEPATLGLCPDVASLRARLIEAGAWTAAMSGSGATVYGVFPDEASARRAEEQVVSREVRRGDAPLWTRVARSPTST